MAVAAPSFEHLNGNYRWQVMDAIRQARERPELAGEKRELQLEGNPDNPRLSKLFDAGHEYVEAYRSNQQSSGQPDPIDTDESPARGGDSQPQARAERRESADA